MGPTPIWALMICAVSSAHEGRGDDDVDRADALRRMQCLEPTEFGERRVGLALPSTHGVPFGLAMTNEQEAGHGVTVPDLCDRGAAATT